MESLNMRTKENTISLYLKSNGPGLTRINGPQQFGEYHTSVSIANGGAQLSGGTILQIPYFFPSGKILRIYSNGSLNSASVGRKVGASCKP